MPKTTSSSHLKHQASQKLVSSNSDQQIFHTFILHSEVESSTTWFQMVRLALDFHLVYNNVHVPLPCRRCARPSVHLQSPAGQRPQRSPQLITCISFPFLGHRDNKLFLSPAVIFAFSILIFYLAFVTCLEHKWHLKAGTPRSTLIRCPHAFSQVNLVEKAMW